MAIASALLVSAEPVTIQQFTLALRELSISPEACQSGKAAISLLTRRKFDAVIVDLELREQAGVIMDEVRLSASNRTAVTFAIGGGDVDDSGLPQKDRFCLWVAPFSAVNSQHSQACLRTDIERTAALFSVPHL